jgi:hypothetical protein
MIRPVCVRSLRARALVGGLFAAVASPAPASAQSHAPEATARASEQALGPFSLSVDVDSLWRRDPAYQLFTRNERDVGAGLSLGYDILRLGPRTSAALSVGWMAERMTSDTGPTPASLDVDNIRVGLAIRFAVRPWFEPLAQVALGASFGRASVTLGDPDFASTGLLEGDTRSYCGRAGGGFRLRTGTARLESLPLPPLAASLTVEGGFQVGTPMSAIVKEPPPEDDDVAADLIPRAATKLGRLGRTYPYVRVSFALLF